ncbi:MAG: thymidine phosphorylase [Deltaproteobacteria bacterium]|nr:thymidine phosphorylase [Deltaproteobacteria bacterium]
MLMTEVIRAKRDRESLPPHVIRQVIREYTDGTIPDYQMSALLMAVYLNGLDKTELTAWAGAMLHSGEVLDLSSIPGAKVDKHSTGGVGDKISIPLAPLVAVCGVRVPMISGRGLGHTGGTLDKLESIPGFRTDLSIPQFVGGVARVGACLIGQTDSLAPADRKLYALRDVTSTVASIPLIAASIMSKKLAEGVSGLVLDVKVGSGAFMKTLDDARELARTLVAIGEGNGVKTEALLTDMNQPIGRAVGNALEVRESIEVLRGEGPRDTTALVEALGGAMLRMGGQAADQEEGEARIRAAIASGDGLDRFRWMVEFQGGDPWVVDEPDRLPAAFHTKDLIFNEDGFVRAVDTEKIGMAGVLLGGGRRKKEDQIDPAVGMEIRVRIGDAIRRGDVSATIHYNDSDRLAAAEAMLAEAWTVGPEPPEQGPLVIDRIAGAGSPG